MADTIQFPKSVGQIALIEELGLKIPPPAIRSKVTSSARKTVTSDGITTEYYPKTYLAQGVYANLKFAMRYEPVDLRVMNAAFSSIDAKLLAEEIGRERTGKFA